MVGIDLFNLEADGAVYIVIDIGARGGYAVDEAVFDERLQARVVDARGGHGA